MYKILVTIAHPQELKYIKKGINNIEIFGIKIDYLLTGVGGNETIYNLTKYLEINSPDFVLNIGIAGYSENGDENKIIQIGRSYNLNTKKEFIIPIPFIINELNSIGYSEKYLEKIEDLGDEKFVDMESFALEFILAKYRIPRIFIKLTSDKIGEKLDKTTLIKTCEKLENLDYDNIFKKIKDYLDSIPQKTNYEYIKDYYYLTYQEFEILKKLAKKYEVLSKKDFKDFLEINKNLSKKELIEELKK